MENPHYPSVSQLVSMWEDNGPLVPVRPVGSGCSQRDMEAIKDGIARTAAEFGYRISDPPLISDQPERGYRRKSLSDTSESDLDERSHPDEPIIHELEAKTAKVHAKVERITTAASVKDNEVQKLRLELSKFKSRLSINESDLSILKTDLDVITRKLTTAIQEKDELEQQLAESRQREQDLQRQLDEARNEARRAQEELLLEQQQGERLSVRQAKHDQQIEHQDNAFSGQLARRHQALQQHREVSLLEESAQERSHRRSYAANNQQLRADVARQPLTPPNPRDGNQSNYRREHRREISGTGAKGMEKKREKGGWVV